MSQTIKDFAVRLLLIFISCLVCNAAVFAQTCVPGASWCSGTYAYDGMGNIRAIGADTYVYDTAGRLVSGTADVNRTGILSRQDYTYDAFGNRTGASRVAGSVNCPGGCELSPTIDPVTNHITSNGAQYDAAGNLIFIQGPNDAAYTYDAAGRLVHAVAGTDDRQFLYTADDERIATANGATWTWTVRGLDGKVLREFTSLQPQGGLPTSNWQWSKDYVWRDGLLLATVAPTTPGASTTVTQHYHLDHLGTPRMVTGDNGVLLGVHAYYPFGAELNLTPTEQPAELMKFTGHERDLLANDAHTLDYMRARYYNPTVGRLTSPDPLRWIDWQDGNRDDREKFRNFITNPQNFNMYAYVGNNPINRTDPTGMQGCQAGDKKFETCTVTIAYDPKTSNGTLRVTGQNKGETQGTVLLTTSVVVGGDGHVTPVGKFTASVWEKDHVSTKYGSNANTPWSKTLLGGNAFGPYQLHIKELEGRGIYIHGTMGPGWNPWTWGNRILSPTSHGCVRVCNADIFTLHDIMPNPRGNKIIISNEPGSDD
jgi:RHS repeat-associated protein